MPLTDQAMAAQGAPAGMPAGAPPMDPAMMGAPAGAPMPPQGGMLPVDPATGMPIDPATGMPMDPNMMAAQGGMPPVDPATGMPMDPAMMGAPAGAPPMDPAMAAQGGMPPSTGDMAIDMLLQMGAIIMDPSGQPVPPEAIAQLVAEINAQTGGQGITGAQGAQGAGMDEVMATVSQTDKTVAILLDKVDALRDIVDSLMPKKNKTSEDIEKDVNGMDDELAAFLAEQAAQGAGPVSEQVPAQYTPEEEAYLAQQAMAQQAPVAGIDPAQAQQLGLIQAMQQGGR